MSDLIKNGLHGCSAADQYVRPQDELLQQRLEWFQDQKLALMMHFGVYSELGMCESWPLSEEDASWSRAKIDWEKDPATFREQYVNLNRSFNPVRLMPDQWADAAADNGFKYLIFTTKHHDGFCLFDSKLTDYKTTDPSCPFHTHRYADVVRHVFDAFRKRGLGIGAYFSKPDWHCPWYWAEGMDRPVGTNRNPTYAPEEHPELWEKYVQFTHGQMMELIQNYGRIDILWLDGGQVRPQNGQNIRLSEFMAEARKIQPWLLSADRTVGGENENYITPEQSIPDSVIPVPWESCLTIGTSFGYSFDDQYKSPRQLIHLLISIVSRGGNLALNVGPQPDGRLPRPALERMQAMGAWLKVNGDAIYKTRVCPPYEAGDFSFTQRAAEKKVFALMRLKKGESLADRVILPYDKPVQEVTLLGSGAVPFTPVVLDPEKYSGMQQGLEITVPYLIRGTSPLAPVFQLT